MLFKGIPKIRPRSIHPAGELQDKYLFSADKNAKPRYTFGNGAIPTGNSRPSNYFKNKATSKDILIQIFHTKKGKVVAINFGKNGYMVTMIAGKEPTIVKDGNCFSSSEK
jgi:hypothetical protein